MPFDDVRQELAPLRRRRSSLLVFFVSRPFPTNTIAAPGSPSPNTMFVLPLESFAALAVADLLPERASRPSDDGASTSGIREAGAQGAEAGTEVFSADEDEAGRSEGPERRARAGTQVRPELGTMSSSSF